ncbi:MAG: sulfur carrier protein ThiS [Candidatus Firestonebacteria bacterium]|nr:sulfur carrier protein ThiS [Candidatus Firestonebacteria bacterium]
MIKVVLNGKNRILNSNLNVTGLLKELELDSRVVAIEINMEIIQKSKYDTLKINNGDKIEIIHLVGGG